MKASLLSTILPLFLSYGIGRLHGALTLLTLGSYHLIHAATDGHLGLTTNEIYSTVFLLLFVWRAAMLVYSIELTSDPAARSMVVERRRWKQVLEEPDPANYVVLWSLVAFGRRAYESSPPWVVVCLGFCIGCLAVFSIVAIGQNLRVARRIGVVVVGYAVFSYALLVNFRSAYSAVCGDEIVGAFFEKPKYRAKYFVVVRPDTGTAPALHAEARIYVDDEHSDYDDGERYHVDTRRVVLLKAIRFADGKEVLFSDCDIAVDGTNSCMDDSGRVWTINLQGPVAGPKGRAESDR